MTKKEKALIVDQYLKEKYPDSTCALEANGDPWKLFVLARLSAQCTDKKVNDISKPLFEKYPTITSFACSNLNELESLIKPCGLYRMKAKNIHDSANIIIDKFNGIVPDTMEDLLSLPGVGRKIANLILGDCFNNPGIVADTHCIRICGRLGFYNEEKKDPLLTEKTMEKLIDKNNQSDFCHRIVSFGRDTCSAQSPKCLICGLNKICTHHNKKAQVIKNG